MKWRNFFSVPNLLCYLRIILIPFFVYAYLKLDNYWLAVSLLVVMEISDLLDGFIARKFNQITDLGKILDPIADKLLQFSLLLILAITYPFSLVILVIFVGKEIILAIVGVVATTLLNHLEGARMCGKVATTVFYVCCLVLVLIPSIGQKWGNLLLLITGCFLIYSFISYLWFYINELRKNGTCRH